MKKITGLIGFIAGSLLSIGILTGCGDQFQEEYPWMIGKQQDMDNTDESGAGATDITVLEKELRGAIPYMINYSHEPNGSWAPHKYQYYRANNIDNYAGYWTTSKGTFSFGGSLLTLYAYPNDYLGGAMDNQIFTQSVNAIFHAKELGKPEWRAVALIIQAYSGHGIVDFYGAAPFTDWRNVNRIPPLTYEKGAAIYDMIFDDLDEAIAILKERQPSKTELEKIEDPNKTISYGDWQRWVKFANSIKLRMAMNIVKYDATKAQQKAEEAVADEIGVLTEKDDKDIAYYPISETSCCLWFISNSWNDLRLNASLENILKHFRNPLLTRWFDTSPVNIVDKNTGIPAAIDVYGMRSGIYMKNINTTDRKTGYGPFATLTDDFRFMHQSFLKRAECLFLRAEGALRGWAMGGTAKDFYEAGIRLAFEENGVTKQETIDEYINRTEVKDVDYVDPFNSEHNIKGRVKVDVKWNEADANELKLEKIITQKYIANFPMSGEAWTTFRRTGYPRLFPVYSKGEMGVDLELQLRRIPLIETENNALEMSSLVEALGGPQNGSTRVFWDVPTEQRGEKSEDNEFNLVIPVNF